MIKAVIFDLNGVFVKSCLLSDRFEEDFNVKKEEFLPALKEVMRQVRMPNAPSVYSLWKPYFDRWGLQLNKEELLKYWFGAEGEDEEMLQLAKDLKKSGLKLIILSNNFRERAAYYREHFPFLGERLSELFEKVYYSWELGYIKSDPRAYRVVLKENNLRPEECIFFDDSEGNVELAASLGIKSYLYENPKKTRDILKRELVK